MRLSRHRPLGRIGCRCRPAGRYERACGCQAGLSGPGALAGHSQGALEPLRPLLEEALDFLSEAKQRGDRCLIHCHKGASRSAAVALAYLVCREELSLHDAWDGPGNPCLGSDFGMETIDFQAERPLRGCLSQCRAGVASPPKAFGPTQPGFRAPAGCPTIL